ncbi:hypothetical protein D3C71_2083220 [compost metagenome]
MVKRTADIHDNVFGLLALRAQLFRNPANFLGRRGHFLQGRECLLEPNHGGFANIAKLLLLLHGPVGNGIQLIHA